MALRGDSEQSREEGEQSAERSCVWCPCRRRKGRAPLTRSLFFTLALSPHSGENDQHESQPDYRRHDSSGRPPSPLPISAAPYTPGSGKCAKGAVRVVLRLMDQHSPLHTPHVHSHGIGQVRHSAFTGGHLDPPQASAPENQLLKWTQGQEPGTNGGHGQQTVNSDQI